MAEQVTGDRVYAEQVRQLYRLSRPSYLGTLINSSILVFALWGIVSGTLLGAWLCAMFLVTGARYLLYRAHRGTNPPDQEARLWARRFVMGTGAAGVLWGVAGSVLYPASSLPHQFLVIFLIGGMMLAAMVVLAPLRQAFLTYVLPAFIPLIATVFVQGTTLHIFMGVLIVVLLGVVLGTSPILAQTIRESLRVKFENSALIEQLSQANRELSERIGAQQKAEEVLRQTSQKFEALIEASPISIIARDQRFAHRQVECRCRTHVRLEGAGSAGPGDALRSSRSGGRGNGDAPAIAAGRTAQRSRNGAPAQGRHAHQRQHLDDGHARCRGTADGFYQPCHRHHRAQARRAADADGALRHPDTGRIAHGGGRAPAAPAHHR